MRATTCGLVAILGCLPVFAQPAPDAAAPVRLRGDRHRRERHVDAFGAAALRQPPLDLVLDADLGGAHDVVDGVVLASDGAGQAPGHPSGSLAKPEELGIYGLLPSSSMMLFRMKS